MSLPESVRGSPFCQRRSAPGRAALSGAELRANAEAETPSSLGVGGPGLQLSYADHASHSSRIGDGSLLRQHAKEGKAFLREESEKEHFRMIVDARLTNLIFASPTTVQLAPFETSARLEAFTVLATTSRSYSVSHCSRC